MINFKEDKDLMPLNHSCAHVMAQAVKHLYPEAKFWVGPVVEEGFYYTAGKIRNVPVSIGGTKWIPDLPIESVIKEELEEILRKEINEVDKAIELLLYTMKKQIFIDGNKRTSVIFINHYLISKGKGIIAIPAELTEEFKDLLISYYEGKDTNKIKRFIKEKCYMGI